MGAEGASRERGLKHGGFALIVALATISAIAGARRRAEFENAATLQIPAASHVAK